MITEPLKVVRLWYFFLAARVIGMPAVEAGYRFAS
jgi:hypothetical protein